MKSKLYYGIRCYKRYMTHTDIKYILHSLSKEIYNLWLNFYSVCHSWFGKIGKFQKPISAFFFISFLFFCISIGMGNLATATPVYAPLKSFVDNLPTAAPIQKCFGPFDGLFLPVQRAASSPHSRTSPALRIKRIRWSPPRYSLS